MRSGRILFSLGSLLDLFLTVYENIESSSS